MVIEADVIVAQSYLEHLQSTTTYGGINWWVLCAAYCSNKKNTQQGNETMVKSEEGMIVFARPHQVVWPRLFVLPRYAAMLTILLYNLTGPELHSTTALPLSRRPFMTFIYMSNPRKPNECSSKKHGLFSFFNWGSFTVIRLPSFTVIRLLLHTLLLQPRMRL